VEAYSSADFDHARNRPPATTAHPPSMAGMKHRRQLQAWREPHRSTLSPASPRQRATWPASLHNTRRITSIQSRPHCETPGLTPGRPGQPCYEREEGQGTSRERPGSFCFAQPGGKSTFARFLRSERRWSFWSSPWLFERFNHSRRKGYITEVDQRKSK
jgi:hypothetical protein